MARAPRAAAAAAPAEPPAPAPAPAPPAPEPAAAPSAPDQFDAAFAEATAAEVDRGPTDPASAANPQRPPAPVPAGEPPQPQSPTGEPIPPQPTRRAPQPQPQNPPPQPPIPEPTAPEPEPTPAPPPPVPPQPQQPPPAPQPPPAAAQPQPQPQAYQEPPLFNAEEVTQLQTFYNDWPDVARATETMIKGIMAQTARRMYSDMAASLAPYLQTIDTLADRSQLSELQGQVPDYETVVSQLNTWTANQPAYLRSAYESVIKSGTAAEVVDLIRRYKQDMQSTTPAQGDQPASAEPAAAAMAPAPAPAPVNPALAAAAARLAPVSTKRTNVVAPAADFDSAFAEFARAS